MPIYQYNCQACGHQVEVLQKVSEAPLTDCPECGQPALRKGITAAAFRLKGTGWYETDFKNKYKSKGANSADRKSTKGTDSSVTKSEASKAKEKGSAKAKTGGTTASD